MHNASRCRTSAGLHPSRLPIVFWVPNKATNAALGMVLCGLVRLGRDSKDGHGPLRNADPGEGFAMVCDQTTNRRWALRRFPPQKDSLPSAMRRRGR